VRVRILPGVPEIFWRARATDGTSGVALAVSPTGQLVLYNLTGAGAGQILGSATTLVVDTWYRLDVLLQFGGGDPSPSGDSVAVTKTRALCSVWVDGASTLNATPPTIAAGGTCRTAAYLHVSSEIGGATGGTFAIDVDDWMNAEWPASWQEAGGATGIDWKNGSRMALVSPAGFGATNVWLGDWQTLLQNPAYQSNTDELSNSTSGALLVVTTDADREVDHQVGGVGVAAMVVSLFSRGGGNAQLGYKVGAAAAALTVIVETFSLQWKSILYRPAGLVTPADVTTLELVYVKSADVTLTKAAALHAVVELLGTFGQEDYSPGATVESFTALVQPPRANIHNAPYPRTPWATSRVPPIAPVTVKAGSYVGAAAGVGLTFRDPVAFLWVRRTDSAVESTRWWSSMYAAHRGGQDDAVPSMLVRAETNPAFVPVVAEDEQETQTILRVTGTDTGANTPAGTYAYLALSDPGMRFVLNGALRSHKGLANIVTQLVASGWTPEAGFFQQEQAAASAVSAMFYKGPGHAAASLSVLTAAELANAVTFAAGEVMTQTAFHPATNLNQIACSLWRQADGNNDPGVVVFLGSYVGDGAASRSQGVTLGGKFPLWALVVPHNAASMMRDHAHTGTTSTVFPSAINAATGIVGGYLDGLKLGSALNANGIIYDVFVIPGGTEANADGFSLPGEFYPVPPESPVEWPGGDSPEEPDFTVVEPPVEGPPGLPTTPGTCLDATTKICNKALSHLGITQEITALLTEQTPEAYLARLHYIDELEATLRAFPWPFATKYATPVWVAGTATVPVNDDWTYSYRVPSDYLFGRRFVTARGLQRAFDPLPITWRVGADATGWLLYSNVAIVDARLEYTCRPVCAALTGDVLFRTALAYRLAAAMGPGLSRDAKLVTYCAQMYLRTLPIAEVTGANEAQPDPNDGDASWIRGHGEVSERPADLP